MAVVMEVICEGHTHRLEVRDDGTFHMLDHEEIDVRAFVAFGAKPPGCLEEIDKAREEPASSCSITWTSTRRSKVLLVLRLRRARAANLVRVLPRRPQTEEGHRSYSKVRGWKDQGVHAGKNEGGGVRAGAAMSAAWAAGAAGWRRRRRGRRTAGSWASAKAAADGGVVGGEGGGEGVGAAYHHAKAHGKDPEAARAAEKKWQAGRMVQVVEAISRGEDPWQS